ncbi:MAG TPA: response regulator transcription factor [Bryobacterales bacterium]|nr:response regulator transcription factor [Bryobacterales bacterium]
MTDLLTQSIKLLLVDDHAMFCDGLARILEKEPDMKVVGKCASAAQALSLLPKSGATMVLLDFDLGAERAVDFVAEARQGGFKGQILVVTAGVSDQEAVQLIQAGVAGILHKHNSAEVLCSVVRQVAAGEVCLEKSYLKPLFRTVDRSAAPTRPTLTDRDKTVLRCIFQGLANKEIGARLQISEGAVKASLRQLFDKLAVRTRAQLVKVALEQYRDQL